MKQPVEKRKPNGLLDYLALSVTTFGVGYIPGAPGTYGSAVGVIVYLVLPVVIFSFPGFPLTYGVPFKLYPWVKVGLLVLLFAFIAIGIWASNRAIPLLGNEDAPEAVVDEVMGQLITFLFVPTFSIGWPFILAGFLLFRVFDIWKPYPIRDLEVLPGGLGICADDIVAGVYAGICLAVGYAVTLAL